jgi:hypothetical protein
VTISFIPTRTAFAALGALAAASVVATPASAGFFDFLFGGGYQRPAPQYYAPAYERAPLDVRVDPRRRAPGQAKARTDKESAPKKVVNKAIDPKAHPNWFLEDPTLKRGDIVVLPTGAMVYEGGSRPQTKQDFAKLSDSRLVSKKERERINDMVGPPIETAVIDGPAKEASVVTNPVQ